MIAPDRGITVSNMFLSSLARKRFHPSAPLGSAETARECVGRAEKKRKRGQPITWFARFHIPSWVWAEAEAVGALWRSQTCKRTLALLEVPRCIRAAIVFTERVISCRSRAAMASLAGSLLRRGTYPAPGVSSNLRGRSRWPRIARRITISPPADSRATHAPEEGLTRAALSTCGSAKSKFLCAAFGL